MKGQDAVCKLARKMATGLIANSPTYPGPWQRSTLPHSYVKEHCLPPSKGMQHSCMCTLEAAHYVLPRNTLHTCFLLAFYCKLFICNTKQHNNFCQEGKPLWRNLAIALAGTYPRRHTSTAWRPRKQAPKSINAKILCKIACNWV